MTDLQPHAACNFPDIMEELEGIDNIVGLQSHPEEQLRQFLELLEKYQHDAEKNGQYEEADQHRSRQATVRKLIETKHRDELLDQQRTERESVDAAHRAELQEFNDIWDRKEQEFREHADSLKKTLEERHKQEHAEEKDRLSRLTEPRTPRWSRNLLDLRKIQESLAKQKMYAEAARTKSQADVLEKKEMELWKKSREVKIASLISAFIKKQQLEMGGLLKRIRSGCDEQKAARETELKRLLQRYNNVKTQLGSQHKIVCQRHERYSNGLSPMGQSVGSVRPGSSGNY